MSKEIELKLTFPSRYIKFMQDMSWLEYQGITAPTVDKLYSIYYDTPDLRLKNSGCSLRLRRIGKTWIQTIKSGGHISAGLHQHDEWEVPIHTNQPDFTQANDPTIKQLFKNAKLQEELQPVFVTKFTRHTQRLRLAQDSEIEFCFDHGKIIAGSKHQLICEIELELKSGNPLEIFRFASSLVDKSPFPLRLENASKAERGYILYSGYFPSPVKATKIEITTDIHLNTALKMIIESCLDQLSKNENGVLAAPDDIEYLHQVRVALRRLRSAINLLYPASSDPEVTSIRKDLKWLTQKLNPARDWDIFITETFPQIAPHFPQHPGFPLIFETCQTLRHKHKKAARLSLHSRRYTKLLLGISIWLDGISQCSPQKVITHTHNKLSDIPIKTSVTTLMADLHQKIAIAGKKLHTLDAVTLHALRICIKKQRYISEFFRELFPQKVCKDYIFLLSNLQDVLGSINDYVTTQKFLGEICIQKNKKAQQHEAIGIIYGWATRCMLEKRKELEYAWTAFSQVKPFWENDGRR